MKKRVGDLTEKEYVKTLDLLYTAASSIQGRSAVKSFLRDLLTPSERIMLGRRIWIARLLLQGESCETVAQRLRTSLRTIYSVQRWLKEQFSGYKTAMKGVEKEMDRRAIRAEAHADPFSYAALKKRYPLHFLFFPEPKPKKKYRQ